jgi:hypothetical protein
MQMYNKSNGSRTMAKRYLELPRQTEDTGERERLLGYASVYEQHLSDPSVRHEPAKGEMQQRGRGTT